MIEGELVEQGTTEQKPVRKTRMPKRMPKPKAVEADVVEIKATLKPKAAPKSKQSKAPKTESKTVENREPQGRVR